MRLITATTAAAAAACLLAACGTATTSLPTATVTATTPTPSTPPCPKGHSSPAHAANLIRDVQQASSTVNTGVYASYERGDFNPALTSSTGAIKQANSAAKRAATLIDDAIKQSQADVQACTHIGALLRAVLSQLNDIGPQLVRGNLAAVASLHDSTLALQHQVRLLNHEPLRAGSV